MKRWLNLGRRFLDDEKAAEVTELGIVLALIVAGCVAAIAVIGPIVTKAYTDTGSSLSTGVGGGS